MTAELTGQDRFADDLVLGADPVLEPWNRAGSLSAADLHIVDKLGRLTGERIDDDAKLGVALAVRAVRQGSTCLALNDVAEFVAQFAPDGVRVPSARALLDSLARCHAGHRQLRRQIAPVGAAESDDGPLLYLHKYFRQEDIIRSVLGDPGLPRTRRRPGRGTGGRVSRLR